jgi:hypothetical protein
MTIDKAHDTVMEFFFGTATRLVTTITILTVVSMAIGGYIDYQNFHECRAHGFSTLFCFTQLN